VKTIDNFAQAFHDGLDFVSVHEGLLQEVRSTLSSARGRQPLDAQLDTILKAKGSKVFGKPAFTHVRQRDITYNFYAVLIFFRLSKIFSGSCCKGRHYL